MSLVPIKTILVVGAGQMGGGIAEVCAGAGYRVLLSDTDLTRARQGCSGALRNVERRLQKGTVSEDVAAQVQANLSAVEEGYQEADLVIEAVSEDTELKAKIFRAAATKCPPHTILASNTSSISITRIASFTSRPEKVVGLHFMNPVPLMQLVELVQGLNTSRETLETARALAVNLGKDVIVSRDRAGFVVNRILAPLINEAIFAVQEELASVEDIDQGARLGLNHPMGPLELADLIGLDTVLSILMVLHQEFGDPKYRPSPLLRTLVDAGRLGRKARLGFYAYDERGKKLAPSRLFSLEE